MPNAAPEEWARRVLAVALDAEVVHHDDNSQPSMYDLRVGPASMPSRVVEVVGAVDESWAETWSVGPGRSAIRPLPSIAGRWTASLEAGAHVKTLMRELPSLIADLDRVGATKMHEIAQLPYEHRALQERIAGLGLDYLHRDADTGPGQVMLTMQGQGGAIDGAGTHTPPWVSQFLRDEEQADVLHKLRLAPSEHREVFIIVTLAGAPWSVMSYLIDISKRTKVLPPTAPDLPEPVTGIWLAAEMSFSDEPVGVRWDGHEWSLFRARGEGIDAL